MNKIIGTFIELLPFPYSALIHYIPNLATQSLHLGIMIELTVLQKNQATLPPYL